MQKPINASLQSLRVEERPQERLERVGAETLSDTDLLAMLLRSGCKGQDVMEVAGKLLERAGSLSALLRLKIDDYREIKGIGKIKALQLLTVMEIARRILQRGAAILPVLSEPDKVYDYLLPRMAGLDVEKFWVLSLNRKNRLLRLSEVTSGTANSSLVHPREVYREAIRNGASAIICAHNHPSGDPAPSGADIRVTKQLRQAAEIVQIDLLDHVIVGQADTDPAGRGYYSFSEAGFL